MTLGLDQFSLVYTDKLINHFDLYRKRTDLQRTTREHLKKFVNDWIMLRFGKQETKMMEGAMFGFDERTAAILIGCGIDVSHCVNEQEVVQESWDEDFVPMRVEKHIEIGVPYYPSMALSPAEKKDFVEKNQNVLLGNGVVHTSAQVLPDLFLGMGAVVGPMSWIGPRCNIGQMATISSHCSITQDVIIGDYCVVGENVSIHSGVRIGAGCSIGAGAVIFKGVTIDPGVIVQPCQVVRTSLKNGGLARVRF